MEILEEILKSHFKEIIFISKKDFKKLRNIQNYIYINKNNVHTTYVSSFNDKIYIIFENEITKITKEIINGIRNCITMSFIYSNHYDSDDSDY